MSHTKGQDSRICIGEQGIVMMIFDGGSVKKSVSLGCCLLLLSQASWGSPNALFENLAKTVSKQTDMGSIIRFLYLASEEKSDKEALKKEFDLESNQKIPPFSSSGNKLKFAGLEKEMVFSAKGPFNYEYQIGNKTWRYDSKKTTVKNIEALTVLLDSNKVSSLFFPSAYAETSAGKAIAQVGFLIGTGYLCLSGGKGWVTHAFCFSATVGFFNLVMTAAFGDEIHNNPIATMDCQPRQDDHGKRNISFILANGRSRALVFDRTSDSDISGVRNDRGEDLSKLNIIERYSLMALDNICQEPGKVAQVNRALKIANLELSPKSGVVPGGPPTGAPASVE